MPRVFLRSARHKPGSDESVHTEETPDDSSTRNKDTQWDLEHKSSENVQHSHQHEELAETETSQSGSPRAISEQVLDTDFIKEVSLSGGQGKGFMCIVCDKLFRHQYAIKRHLPIHTDERKYKCSYCGKGFRQASTLSRHKAVHSTERDHECTVCSATFRRASSLETHMKTHTSEKKFKCPACNKAFHQKINLKTHMFTHTGERPYKCATCDKAFSQKSNLDAHVSQVHKQLLECPLCSKTFQRKRQLEHHKLVHHGKDATPSSGETFDDAELSNPPNDEESGNNLSSKISRIEKSLKAGTKSSSDDQETTVRPENEISMSCEERPSVWNTEKRGTAAKSKLQCLLAEKRPILPLMPGQKKWASPLNSTSTPKLCTLQESKDSPKKNFLLLDQPDGTKLLVPVEPPSGVQNHDNSAARISLNNTAIEGVTDHAQFQSSPERSVPNAVLSACTSSSSVPPLILSPPGTMLMNSGVAAHRQFNAATVANSSTHLQEIGGMFAQQQSDVFSLRDMATGRTVAQKGFDNTGGPASTYLLKHNQLLGVTSSGTIQSMGTLVNNRAGFDCQGSSYTHVPATVERHNPTTHPKPLSALLPLPTRTEFLNESLFSNISSDSNSSTDIATTLKHISALSSMTS